MIIQEVRLYNFRCFQENVFNFDHPCILITGANGSGKTSLLEALHYCCYLRSFRTHIIKELMYEAQNALCIKLALVHDSVEQHILQVGVSDKKRVIKVDQQEVSSYQRVIDTYRAITITEHDMDIVSGSPDIRRMFIDHIVLLRNPSFASVFRMFRTVLAQRNALLAQASAEGDMFYVWTERLWELTCRIQQERRSVLSALLFHVQNIIDQWFSSSLDIVGEYKVKQIGNMSYQELVQKTSFFHLERTWKRSLFGAHLDDIHFVFNQKKARTYASRGQKKLMTFLLKSAHAAYLAQENKKSILLLDDFMTDFDLYHAQKVFSIMQSLYSQVIVSAPERIGIIDQIMAGSGVKHINLRI